MAADLPLHVIIVGGGIGGLFAANALIAHGLRVSVYKQAPALGEVGAGVFLTRTASANCSGSGWVLPWRNRGQGGHDSRYFRQDGTLIAPVQVTDLAGWNATFGTYRADLVTMLAERPPANVIHTGHRGVAFEQDGDMARVSFANGAVAEGDVVIAADGIHSELRHNVVPPSPPVFSGSVAYRGLVRYEHVPECLPTLG